MHKNIYTEYGAFKNLLSKDENCFKMQVFRNNNQLFKQIYKLTF